MRVARRDAECIGSLLLYLLVFWEPDCVSPTAISHWSLPLPGITEHKQCLAHRLCKHMASPRGQQQGHDYTGTAEQSESLALWGSKVGEVRPAIPMSPWEGAARPGLERGTLRHPLPLCLISSQGTTSLALQGVVSCHAAFSHVQILVCSSCLGKAGKSWGKFTAKMHLRSMARYCLHCDQGLHQVQFPF